MKQKHLKILAFGCVALVIFSLISTKKSKPAKQAVENVNNFSESSMANSNDYLRAVSARLNQSDKDFKKLSSELRGLKNENERLKKSLETKARQPSGDMQALNQTIHTLEGKISALSKPISSDNEQVTQSDGQYAVHNQSAKPIQYVVDLDEGPSDYVDKNDESVYWSKLKNVGSRDGSHNKSNRYVSNKDDKKGIPYYTIPAGSDLASTTLLSALIGEVPVDSKLAQPLFPFSAVVGRGSLMSANGVPLPPDIRGMKVSGYAIGVGSFLDNISCARAYVTQALFVFQDGHFEVVGEERMRNATDMVDNKALGYLTTAFGNPCIPGTYYTNAPRVLAALTGAAGVSGAGKALSQFQMSYFAGSAGAVGVPTGSIGKYALGEGLSSGSVKAAEWLEHRIKGSFDMVFVPASIPVKKPDNRICFVPNRLTLHITKTIEINKDLNARRISYGKNDAARFDYDFK
ncbi:TPA: TIGR03752 family integrating conjugative element protein [Legionella pneumophila]|nr:TIGR03752 family integrating conjugative element protein [Legionella pneumophila]HBD7283618.1 TIGR03752 family integrating conjugative element protein [Legionella pneumophila]HEN8241137.1 TIGR03752 family integrating conjugative element protein [Legionella pneumophila]